MKVITSLSHKFAGLSWRAGAVPTGTAAQSGSTCLLRGKRKKSNPQKKQESTQYSPSTGHYSQKTQRVSEVLSGTVH